MKEKEAKESEEKDLFQPIVEAIGEVQKSLKNNQNLEFIGSFIVLNLDKLEGDEDDVLDDTRIFAHGVKESLKVHTEELIEQIDKEKEDFINW